jgi:hypothetical protein
MCVLTDEHGYGDWIGAAHFEALRKGEADPAQGLGEKDQRGYSAIEREFVGTRLHAAALTLRGNLVDDLWRIRYLQDVAALLKAVLELRTPTSRDSNASTATTD